ncbi:MAG: amidohydrolase family protein [Phycisphaerae bacterium]|nr:amidohydrolase family protein [Phycisphaerae bacterium]MDW8261078.1 amidohydrolase family protein [Phycisphaerales bacterium]
MVVDVHVHISALSAKHGMMSRRLLRSLPFRFMKSRLGLRGEDESTEASLRHLLIRLLEETPELDAAVVLAFDAVYDESGRLNLNQTHLYTKNDYVIQLARQHRKILFGASIHPYRRDAIEELERCVRAGAVLVKWLPITQGMNPADPRCIAFYEAMAHHGIPLLCHTGGEKSLPNIAPHTASPLLLVPALQRGVTVIAAHCGTRSAWGERDYVPDFMRLCHDWEHFYGDTAALNLPTRSHAYPAILADTVVRSKLLHGSDWPILPVPPAAQLGLSAAAECWLEPNWLRRDLMIKRRLGFEPAYWTRAAEVLRLPDGQLSGSSLPVAASSVS